MTAAVAPGAARPGRVERGERILATGAAVSRLGGLLVLAAALPTARLTGATAGLLAAAGLGSALLSIGWLRYGRLPATWAAGDTVLVATVLVLTGTGWLSGARAGESPAYNFASVATIGLSLTRWPWPAGLAAAGTLAAANLVTSAAPGSDYPLWNAVPDSLMFVGVTAVGWVLGWLLRTSAATLARRDAAALERAGALARERERARHSRALGARLLSTLDDLARGEAVDPAMREQVRREAEWLRGVVTDGLPERGGAAAGALGAALRGLVAEKAVGGLRVDLDLPGPEPGLSTEATVALVEAAREALTNVAKHAGTRTASVAARPDGDEWVVEVSDTGRGFDPATTRARIGHTHSIRQRLAEVGGRADIESAAGAGTRVRLAVPYRGGASA
jgi:signal transduction histidine kinase